MSSSIPRQLAEDVASQAPRQQHPGRLQHAATDSSARRSQHSQSAKTHAGNVFVTRDIDL